MYIAGTPEQIVATLLRDAPNLMAPRVAKEAAEMIAPARAQMLPWQGAALYALARPHNRCGGNILEIGTAGGYSATILSRACPNAHITTLNPVESEVSQTAPRLVMLGNVTSLCVASWDYLRLYHGPRFDLIFIDGDHKRCALDLPWWEYVRPLGVMLFHDYSPSACPPVFGAVAKLGKELGREPDIVVMDDHNVGIAGFCRME